MLTSLFILRVLEAGGFTLARSVVWQSAAGYLTAPISAKTQKNMHLVGKRRVFYLIAFS